MASAAPQNQKRILKELADCKKNPPPDMEVDLLSDSLASSSPAPTATAFGSSKNNNLGTGNSNSNSNSNSSSSSGSDNGGGILEWVVTLDGPAESYYAGGRYRVRVSLPPTYPFHPPKVWFETRIYHPNVTNDADGSICLALLKPDQWKPATRLAAVLGALRDLLLDPRPDDPLEVRIAEEFTNDRNAFVKTARSYVKKYASGASKWAAVEGGTAESARAI